MVTCTVISAVFQPFQSIDEDIHNLLTSLRSQVVEVRKDSTHLYSCKIRSILNCQKLASHPHASSYASYLALPDLSLDNGQ